ncbi:MAG: M67 family metallopeptidase [Sphingobium sp.]
MKVRISRAALDAIREETRKAGEEECCGLLLALPASPPDHIDAILPAANVAADRRGRFEIDPAQLIAAHRAERAGHHRIMGCYHSHPGGDAAPSAEDAAQAEANGSLWLIATPRPWAARLWRAVGGGAAHGRFDAAQMIVADDP